MDGFRAILAILGLVVVALVYWYTQRESRRRQVERIEPTFGDDPVEFGTDDEIGVPAPELPVDEPEASAAGVPLEQTELLPDEPGPDTQAETEAEKNKIVAIRVVARDDETLGGEKLVLTLRGLGLRHGQYGVFHRHDGDDDTPVFSVANLTEPGSFELANIREQSFTGVSLFLVLPGPMPGAEAFDMMIETARTLAKAFEADLLDATGSTLSIQRERFMREEVIEFEHAHALRVAR